MPQAVIPFIPLISAGVQGGFSALGSHMQASAESEAAGLQHQTSEEALADARAQRAWQQEQYMATLQRLLPYTQAGANSLSIASSLLSRSPYARTALPAAQPTYQQPAMIAPAMTGR